MKIVQKKELDQMNKNQLLVFMIPDKMKEVYT